MRLKSTKLTFVLIMAVTLSTPVRLYAQIPTSNSYSVPESGFTTGSEIDANSASYNARTSIGNLGIGQSESGSYIGFGGFITPDEEYVELIVPTATIDLGGGSPLTPGVAGSGVATFSARSYLNNVYVIITPRDSPSNGSSQIDPMTSATTFNSAIEQFGMNLVANTSPVVQGSVPSRQPVDNGTFAFGEAAPGYSTADNYQYNAGDVIARSVTRGYGETDYTISYMINITTITPAGEYRMEQDLVMLATF